MLIDMPPQNLPPNNLPGYQPPPPNQPLGQSGQYDFIMGSARKKPGFSFSFGGGKGGLIALAGIGLVIVFILFMGYSLLFGNKPSVTAELVDIAARQQEIARISSTISPKLRDSNLLAINSVARVTTISDQSKVLTYLASFGVKPKANELSVRADAQADALLASAEQNGRLEDEYATVLATKLKDYQASLKAVYDVTESAQTKEIMQVAFDNAQAVLATGKLTTTR